MIAELWQERPTWYCNDLRRDPLASESDLARMAAALGIEQIALAPLIVRGTRRGMIRSLTSAAASSPRTTRGFSHCSPGRPRS